VDIDQVVTEFAAKENRRLSVPATNCEVYLKLNKMFFVSVILFKLCFEKLMLVDKYFA
jgi:hypothetical protein